MLAAISATATVLTILCMAALVADLVHRAR